MTSVALLAALPRQLDADAFAVATGTDAEQFAWLRRQAFIRPQSQGFRYCDVVRSPMLRVLRRHSPQRLLGFDAGPYLEVLRRALG